tara:strand:- start:9 stop:182 length:174 start_codon:yes stop_codon:yes gene_type:complete
VCKALANERAQLVVYDPRVSEEAITVCFTDDDGAAACVGVEADPYASTVKVAVLARP